MSARSPLDFNRLYDFIGVVKKEISDNDDTDRKPRAMNQVNLAWSLTKPYLNHPENAGYRYFRDMRGFLETLHTLYLYDDVVRIRPQIRDAIDELTRLEAQFSGAKRMETAHADVKRKGLPFPDPLGILEGLTGGAFFDPVLSGRPKDEPAPATGTDAGEADPHGTYVWHLEQAYRLAPCNGCRKIVESGLVAAEIVRITEETGKTVEQVKDEEIDAIKAKIKQRVEVINRE